MNTVKHSAKWMIATLGLCVLFSTTLFAQNKSGHHSSFIGYPIGFHLPETGWGVGAAMAYQFHWNEKDTLSPASQVQLGFAFTQNKQLLFSLPFQFYWNERQHQLLGEVAYNDYTYLFYGVGHQQPEDKQERYAVKFPLFRLNYLYKISKNVYTGPRWWWEDYRIQQIEKSPWLTSGEFTGGQGGRTSGPGWVFLLDSRDQIYYTRKGLYLELVAHDQHQRWGSDYRYQRYRFDLRYFASLHTRWTLASMLFGDFLKGNVPFQQLASIGSDKRMRGFYPGRFRDYHLWLYQGELRTSLYKRWSSAAFWNWAMLAPNLQNLSIRQSHFATGIGLRFAYDRRRQNHIRLDAAVPLGRDASSKPFHQSLVFYFTINEAF